MLFKRQSTKPHLWELWSLDTLNFTWPSNDQSRFGPHHLIWKHLTDCALPLWSILKKKKKKQRNVIMKGKIVLQLPTGSLGCCACIVVSLVQKVLFFFISDRCNTIDVSFVDKLYHAKPCHVSQKKNCSRGKKNEICWWSMAFLSALSLQCSIDLNLFLISNTSLP